MDSGFPDGYCFLAFRRINEVSISFDMLFNTWTFLVFLAVTFVAYHFLPWPGRHRVWWQIGLLTVASYVFYAWHTPWLVIILAASTWINAYVTLRLVRPGTPPEERKKWVTFAIMANLGVLIFFKYTSLVVGTFLPHSWWSHWGFDLTQIPLPVGISFFTFQGISLVVDVYRKPSVVLEDGKSKVESRKSSATCLQSGKFTNAKLSTLDSRPSTLFFKVAFFKAFFPQLVAGPIVKAHEFMHQIGAKTLASVDWDDAVKKLILGFFLKMVVADNLREATAWLHYPEFVGKPASVLILMLYGFSFQIFADFAGYSLIAMGLARLFGYELPMNFNFPYISPSITEFWRRWHISLSTWLREYLYIPLGGNRKGALRTYANLILVMLLGGLWHGAAWSFMIWGCAHGICLAAERLFGVKVEGERVAMLESWKVENLAKGFVAIVRIFLIFNLVSLLWLLFQLPNFKDVLLYIHELSLLRQGGSPQILFTVAFFGMPVILYHFWALLRPLCWDPFKAKNSDVATYLMNGVYGMLLFLIIVNSGGSGSFLYFQF
jgi:alginate O-acetyltransferase complex protein AlgI